MHHKLVNQFMDRLNVMIGVYVGFAMSNYICDMLECASYLSFLPPRFSKRILPRKTSDDATCIGA